MAFEVKGTLKKLFDQQDFPSGFYKRDFVITTLEQYPQDIKFSALKEKTEQLGQFSEGDVVNVKFDLRGREYNGNYYVDLNAWRIERGDAAEAVSSTQAGGVSAAPMPSVPPMPTVAPVEDDDLPF
jgi:single-strand DNA-binding protein